MDVLGWMKHKLESRLPGEISITSNMQTHHPYGRKRSETKESLAEGERREWKSWLKTQHSKNEDYGIQSHHFMAKRWGNNETVMDFIFLGSKITADGDCSHEIKRHLLLWRKARTNLDSILKSRHIILLTNVPRVKATVFLVVRYRSESWTIKKTECQKLMLLNCDVGEDSKSLLDSKEIKPVNPKGTQPWILIRRTDAEVEVPILCQPDVKNQLIGKYCRQKELGAAEDEMVK